ncbi:hypothetical protein MGMO_112c00010 [Methyloglobulus morosus KoM1]|uniref:Orc1-like AAA ATPase domain-containing protein n=1 Tax=Methyloglobulus morosus KoM1 TaxID=1116472 RepID=V5C377_9GAMM|nr:tetratricopeptide repeat protein [Methyloglobulus morosus]ESS71263.1 hypothetical protein MGMO_112c00010 [Methyloglobulus morosus KoM1]
MDILRFTGRRSELDQIIERWYLAANIMNPNPQIVILKGERGVGKTRLAFEFYRWLSENIDQQDSTGYWPDALAIYENTLDINPQPRSCNFHSNIPYLWWGLAVSKDTIPQSDRYLAPHLAILLANSIKRRKGIEFAVALSRLGIDVGMDVLADLTYLNLAKRIGEAGKEVFGIIRGGLSEASVEEALKLSYSRSNSIIQNLELVFDPEKDYAEVPGVILIDDAQDASKDSALLSFVETLFYKAITRKWPLLILVTHWKRELFQEVTPQEYSFAGILRHGLLGNTWENGPAAGLPGGYLNSSSFLEINLGPLIDLSAAISEKLPGLTDEQSASIHEVTGGNPRYLEQVIQFAREHEGFFENYDTSKALTIEGFREILAETKSQDIFKVVRRRLIDAPLEVREAICLASLQGLRFASDLVDAIANIKLGRNIRSALENAEDPYSWLAGTKSQSADVIGSFVERLFHQVAEDVRPHMKTLGTEAELQVTFRDTIRNLVQDYDFIASDRPETQLIAYGIAADLFESSSEPTERMLAQWALSLLAKVHLYRFSLEAGSAAYERLLEIEEPDRQTGQRVDLLRFLSATYWKLNWHSKCSFAIKRRIYEALNLIGDQGRILAFAGDKDGVMSHFTEWKEKTISAWEKEPEAKTQSQMEAAARELYHVALLILVPALLEMSELARAWQGFDFTEGDDSVRNAPFLITLKLEGGNIGSDDEVMSNEIGDILCRRAYNLGAFIKPEYAEREHFKLLVDEIAMRLSDEGERDQAMDALNRALNIAKDLGDLVSQIQVLANLGVVHGRKGDREQSEKVLLEAGRIYNENYTGEAFSVVALSNDEGVEHRRSEAVSESDKSRILGHLDIPFRLASLFDQNPDEAVGQFRQLVRMVGNIEANLGHNAHIAGEFEKAEDRYKYALSIFADLNNGPDIAMTLTNLAMVAEHCGNKPKACDYWRQSLSVFKKLKTVHAGDFTEIRWDNAIQDLEAKIEAPICGNQ